VSAWLFTDPVAALTPSGPDELAAALAWRDGWTVLALDYEFGYLFEPASAPPAWRRDPARPLARLWRFAQAMPMRRAEADTWLATELAALSDDDRPAACGGLTPAIGPQHHAECIARIRDWIAEGDCYQVNFTFPLTFQTVGSPLALYAALRARQPVRYGGVIVDAAGSVVSLSPELFLEKCGPCLVTRPMKGTAPRSDDPEALRHSAKNRAENLMIVDLLRNDLGRVAATGSVRVESLFEIEAYPTLWQMVSQVAAEVGEQRLGEILPALFPCGSITGAPKIRAMQIIGQLEQAPRGLYTGALGWQAPQGDFRLNVAIRTLELAPDGSGRLGIGSGIVADSDADDEWRECLLKARFLAELDPGFCLIETLRREDGSYPRLVGHLRRLRASAAWWGFAFDEAKVMASLSTQSKDGIWRVRLTLAKDGALSLESTPLMPEPVGERIAWLAEERIASRHPLRHHKTTVRAAYDEALRRIAGRPEVFDVVFCNERGEVAEGARSTVFVERDGVLLTPPLAAGALPGVLRAELLANGRAREAVLRPDDLADGFYLGNSVRGLVAVKLVRA